VDKVFLTASEKARLYLSPGRLADVFVLPTAAGRLGVAISLDAFTADLQVSQADLPCGQRT
jgi:predicted amidohydrolase